MSRSRLPWPSQLSSREPCASTTLELRCAFRDCDPMGILWHGQHLAYCESARHHLGESIGLGLHDFQTRNLLAPVIRSQVLHQRPIRPEQALQIEVALYPSTQPRLFHRYRITVAGELATEAETEQVLTDAAFCLLLQIPDWLALVFAACGRGSGQWEVGSES